MGLVLLAGCTGETRTWWWPPADELGAAHEVPQADTGFTLKGSLARSSGQRLPAARIDVLMRVLHVRVPHHARAEAARVWEQIHEDACDSATRRRLYRNGVRVGLGRTERWDAVQAVFEGIEGARSYELPALRTPPGVPLALELDREPADQTIFYLGRDGVLSGETWLASRRVLRVTYTLDTLDLSRVYLSVVPEIRRRGGPGLSYTEQGWITGPQRHGRAFAAAAFVLALGANEFALLAPGEKSDVFGLVGGAFLTDRRDDEPYDSYVFLRTDVRHVAQRN